MCSRLDLNKEDGMLMALNNEGASEVDTFKGSQILKPFNFLSALVGW
jgi:hypothetical protein